MIKRLSEEYIDQVAKSQIRLTPEYFLSYLGISFIKKVILKSLISSNYAFSYIYIDNGNVVGYVSGVCSKKFYSFIIKSNFFLCVFYSIIGIIRKPKLLYEILSLTKFLFLKHLRNDIEAEMLTWWVLPEYRINSDFYKMNKVQIGKELWLKANEHFKKNGVKYYRLITPVSNIQSNRFYQKMGYEYVGSFELFDEERNFYIGNVAALDKILL